MSLYNKLVNLNKRETIIKSALPVFPANCGKHPADDGTLKLTTEPEQGPLSADWSRRNKPRFPEAQEQT
eukprot:4614472-Amphidinium_carterae.1